ncbi:hypothetical protein IID24_01725 [Patescibacteria group bacterium]|nr:hypothetical protein [Patescibacteria group bacterium]
MENFEESEQIKQEETLPPQSSCKKKYLLIGAIAVLVVLVVGAGILMLLPQKETKIPTLVETLPTPKVQEPDVITQEVLSVDPTANWQTYRNEKYGFFFSYPEELITSGGRPVEEPFWSSVKTYDTEVAGLEDWSVSESIKEKTSCASLVNEDLSQYIDFNKPYLCRVFNDPQGYPIFYGIGINWYFEGTFYLNSIILVSQNDEAILMSRELPPSFEIEQLYDDSRNAFFENYPGEPWWFGHPAFQEMSGMIDELLWEEITAPSQRIADVMETLDKIVKSIEFE